MSIGSKQKDRRLHRATVHIVLGFVAVGLGTTIALGQNSPVDEILAEDEVVEESNDSPQTVTELFSGRAGSSQSAQRGGGALFDENLISPPTTNDVSTILGAAEFLVQQAGKRLVILSTNGIEKLQAPYKPPFSGRASLKRILSQILPVAFDAWEQPSGESQEGPAVVYMGLAEQVNAKQTEYDSERLANNHARITFVAKGISLYEAVVQVGELAKVDISTEYMDPRDIVEGSTNVVANISEFAASNTVSRVARVYATITQETEWRNVLRRVLDPKGYAFDEVNGYVRVARTEWFAEQERKERESKPLVTRVVRLYHANPEEIVKKILELKITVGSGSGVWVAPFREIGESGERSYRKNMTSGTATISSGSGGTAAGDADSQGGGSWGDLLRPKTPPAIILHDIEENLDTLEKLVRSLDVREKQVLIEALILDLSDDATKTIGMNFEELGFNPVSLGGLGFGGGRSHDTERTSENTFDWEGTAERSYRRTRGGQSLSKSFEETSTDVGSINSSSLREKSSSFFAFYGPLDFNFVLDLVENDGDSRVLSSPVLTIGDHSESMIYVGDVVPVADINTVHNFSNGNDTTEVDVEWIELNTGVRLWVGPEVTEDGKQVRLWVHPRVVDIKKIAWAEVGQSRYPNMTVSELDTRVAVPTGNTLMLGGLTHMVESDTLKKVPLLGDIPFLGRLFRHHETTQEKRNLVLLIRPTILDQDSPETGYEKPALAIADPMLSTSGRNLVARDIGANDRMREREKRIRTKVFGKDDPGSEERNFDENGLNGEPGLDTGTEHREEAGSEDPVETVEVSSAPEERQP